MTWPSQSQPLSISACGALMLSGIWNLLLSPLEMIITSSSSLTCGGGGIWCHVMRCWCYDTIMWSDVTMMDAYLSDVCDCMWLGLCVVMISRWGDDNDADITMTSSLPWIRRFIFSLTSINTGTKSLFDPHNHMQNMNIASHGQTKSEWQILRNNFSSLLLMVFKHIPTSWKVNMKLMYDHGI